MKKLALILAPVSLMVLCFSSLTVNAAPPKIEDYFPQIAAPTEAPATEAPTEAPVTIGDATAEGTPVWVWIVIGVAVVAVVVVVIVASKKKK